LPIFASKSDQTSANQRALIWDKPMAKIFGTSVIALIMVVLLMNYFSQPLIGANEQVVQVCKGPLFRRPKEFIVRDEHGQLFYVNESAHIRQPLDASTAIGKVCKK
jgi:hypothetical protein